MILKSTHGTIFTSSQVAFSKFTKNKHSLQQSNLPLYQYNPTHQAKKPITQFRLTSTNRLDEQPEVQVQIENIKQIKQCPICIRQLRVIGNSKCRHEICLQCWQRTLQIKLQCPICRCRIRKKFLLT